MKKLIITEKPSVAQQFAKTLGVTGRHDGYIENDKYIITWCVGHLVTMSYPEKYDPDLKSWKLDTLPFLPDKYKYEIIKDVKDQFKVVKECLNRSDVDVIYNAGDSGREGEYIQRLVYSMAGWNKKATMKRVWIDSQTDEAIKNGIRDAKDSSCYDNLSDAAYVRAIEDYAIGINFSRGLSCKFGYEFNKKIKSSKYKPISVGRVMTCVLGMIVDKERAIRDFKVTPFYRLEADTGFTSSWKAVKGSYFFESPLLYNDTGFKTKEDAEKLLRVLQKDRRLKVSSVTRKGEKKKAPLLYNLAELQNECSKRFKISPDKTLEIAQKLYESKLTTYPRTDARVISTAVAKEINKNLSGLASYSHKQANTKEILDKKWYTGIANSSYCDDSKITDHYAIIPTGMTDTSSLSKLEMDVFHIIIERFLSIFYPPAEYEKIEVQLTHPSKEQFFASEKILVAPGYLEVTGYEKDKNAGALKDVKEKEILSADFEIKEGKTTPPKRYTTGSLILAMENAGNLIEDEELRAQIKGCGIGTSATRAEIIKKLTKIGYIKVDQKTQVVTPHPDGEAVYEIVKDNLPALLSPKMTANWEKGLSQIEKGEITQQKYLEILYDYIRKNIDSIKSKEAEKVTQIEPLFLGKCPVCGGDIYTARFGCCCSNYKDKKCWFALGSHIYDELNEEQFKKLISTGKTDVIDTFKAKSGKKFSALVEVNKEESKISLVFPTSEAKDTDFTCPSCGEKLKKNGIKLSCACGFSIYAKLCDRTITDQEMKKLLAGEEVYLEGMKSKKGKEFNQYVTLVDGKYQFRHNS